MSDPFDTTRWSMVIASAGDDPRSAEALEWLCARDWYPLYAYVRRRGHGADVAADLTQSFFADLLERRMLQQVAPEHGRFRAFLLAALKNHLGHQRDRERALKRRAQDPAFQVALDDAEQRWARETRTALDPETLFERRWALTILDSVLARLETDYERSGKRRVFEAIRGFATGEDDRSYATVAAELDMNEGAVRVAVLRLRRRLGAALRDEVAQTVADDGEIDDEVRYLLRALES